MDNRLTQLTKSVGQIYRVLKNHVGNRGDVHREVTREINGFFSALNFIKFDNFFNKDHMVTIYDGQNLLDELLKRENVNEFGTFSCSGTAKGVPIPGNYSSGHYRMHGGSGYVIAFDASGYLYFNRCNAKIWKGWDLLNPFSISQKHTIKIYSGENLLSELLKKGDSIGTFSCSNTAQGVPNIGNYSSGDYRIADNSGYVMLYDADGSLYYNRCNGGTWIGWIKISPDNGHTITVSNNVNLLTTINSRGNENGTFSSTNTALGVPEAGIYASGDYRITDKSGYANCYTATGSYYYNRCNNHSWLGWTKVN